MKLSPGSILLIRHARASGQEPEAALTAEGREQAIQLAERLAQAGITRIVSSPWNRAIETASPLAVGLGLPVQPDERLTERVLSRRHLPYWQQALKVSFARPALSLPGGESGKTARDRILAAIAEHRDPHGITALVTHGNLMALALGLNFDGWAALRNPDVWLYSPDHAPQRYPEA